jgi:release factor glutamine methyltransferase
VATLRGLIRSAEHALAEGPHAERARPDAERLLLHVLRKTHQDRNRAWLIANGNLTASPGVSEELKSLVQRRQAGEPIQYIVGETEFYGMPFRVTPDVLIPRPETEHLVEKAIELALTFEKPGIADVGCGSGAIAVALAHNLPGARITATDLSMSALITAGANAQRNGLAEHIRFLQGDLLEPVHGERFELIVSNPPYVAEADREALAVEVRDYEPALALFAGADGLAIYRRLIPAAHAALVPGGYLLLEIGAGQSGAVGDLLSSAGFSAIEFAPDLQAIPRVACAQRL